MKSKKLAAALLVLSAVCLGGCGSKELTAEEVMEKATAKQQEMTSMDADAVMSMAMEADGQSIDYDMDMNIKADQLNSDDMKMYLEMDMNILGQDMSTTAYYEGGYYYVDSMGTKMKMEMDLSEVNQMVSQNSAFSQIPTEAYKTLEMTEEDGNYVITYVADGSKMTEMIDELMGSMLSSTLGETSDMDISLGDVSGTMTVNKDFYVIDQTMQLDMAMSMEGTEISTSVDMDMVLNNPGEAVTVEEPADLDAYEEITE